MSKEFQVIGHRGARGLFPENTIEGFRLAWDAGVRRFEIDVAITRDDVPVLSHDALLNPDITRTEDGEWIPNRGPPIRTLTLIELARYTVGSIRPGTEYARRFPAQRSIAAARIPSLASVLEALPEANLAIELKTYPDRPDITIEPERMVDRVLEVARAARALPRIRLQSFDWRGPRYLGRVAPGVARAWLTEPKTVAAPALWWGVAPRGSVAEAVKAEGGDTWAPEHSSLAPDMIAEARALGLRVVPWTVNDPREMERLRAAGVAGIITDRPDLALSLLTRPRDS